VKKIVIGLVGAKQSGKTTTSNIICSLTYAKPIAFADKLKNVCSDIFNVPRLSFDDQNVKEKEFSDVRILSADKCVEILKRYDINPNNVNYSSVIETTMKTPREIAQTVGTNLLRNLVDPDIHIKSVELAGKGISIPSDIRFMNEFKAFSGKPDIDYYPIYINRKSAEEAITPDMHIAEREFLTFKDLCYKIDNNGTMEYLAMQIDDFLTKVVKI
jgi:hypothetical protein